MKKVLCFLVFVFGFGIACAEGEVETARKARELLSHPSHQAGFEVGQKCSAEKPKKKGTKGKSDKNKVKQKCGSRRLQAFDVRLAVKRDSDKNFTIVEAYGNGIKICGSKTIGFTTACYVGSSGNTNGVNTEFAIEKPEGYRVFAIRRVVSSPTGYKEVVYTPFSDPLNVGSVRQAGGVYVNQVIAQATTELHREGIRSKVDRSRLVVDVVPVGLLRDLAVIEHIDEARFKKESMTDLAKEVYAIYGLNQAVSYNFAVSSAKARGMFQVIPKTYHGIRNTYPKARIKADFVAGTTDHVNVAKLAILLADHDLSLLAKSPESHYADKIIREYLASSYNGGPTCRKNKKRNGLCAKEMVVGGIDLVAGNPSSENRIYIAKLRALWKFQGR